MQQDEKQELLKKRSELENKISKEAEEAMVEVGDLKDSALGDLLSEKMVATPKETRFNKKIEEKFSEITNSPKEEPIEKKNSSPINLPSNDIEQDKTVATKKEVNVLDRIEVDLSSINIINDVNPISRLTNTQTVLKNDAVYQVVCLRSGYSAQMKGLNFKNKDILRNSSLDTYNRQRQLYGIIHDKINEASCGAMTFAEYLKITAFRDIESLLFGIYSQTYPDKTPLTLTCPNSKCRAKNNIEVYPSSFIEVKDKKVYSYLDNIIANQHNPEELLSKSLLNSTERILLPKSKIVVDIRTPSLQDHLDLLSKYNSSTMKDLQDTLMVMMYIKTILTPFISGIQKTGNVSYIPIEDFKEKLNIIYNLAGDDDFLSKAIEEREESHKVEYNIKEINCSSCKEPMTKIPIDIEKLLFIQMEKARQNLTENNQTT
jgi:hypothetical protein